MFTSTEKAVFYTPIEARAMPAPTSKRPEERGFVVDSEASVHLLSKKDSSSEELDTLRRSREVHTNEEAQAYVHDLNLFVTVQHSLEAACCSIAWKTLRRPRIFR